MKTTYHAMTARQRAELEALVSPGTAVLRGSLFVVVVAGIGWLFAQIQTGILMLLERPSALPLWLAATALIGYALYRRAGLWTGGPSLRAQIRQDLERGDFAHLHMTTLEAIEAPEIEDEGPVFFVKDASGATFFFAGQEMARWKSKGFPWTSFEVIEAPASGRFIGLKRVGGSFEGVRVREPLAYAEAQRLGVLEAEFGVLAVGWDDVAGG